MSNRKKKKKGLLAFLFSYNRLWIIPIEPNNNNNKNKCTC